jgi:hypothetical protein
MTVPAGRTARSIRSPGLAAPERDSHHARLDREPDPARVSDALRLARGLLERPPRECDRTDDAILSAWRLVTDTGAQPVQARGAWHAIAQMRYGNAGELSILAWDDDPRVGFPEEPRAAGAGADAGPGRRAGTTTTHAGGQGEMGTTSLQRQGGIVQVKRHLRNCESGRETRLPDIGSPRLAATSVGGAGRG